MGKNPFKKISSVFKKVGSDIKSTFSKNNMDKFRTTLSNVLTQQGDILTKTGSIMSGVALNPITLGLVGMAAPELLPVIGMVGAAGIGVTGGGMIEKASSGLLTPSTYKGGPLTATSNVVEKATKIGKGSASVVKFSN